MRTDPAPSPPTGPTTPTGPSAPTDPTVTRARTGPAGPPVPAPTATEPDGAPWPRLRRPVPLALAWSALTAVWALTWAFDLLPHPFGDAAQAAVGAVFNTSHPLVGSAFTLVLGLVGAGTAAAMLRARDALAPEVVGWLVAATITLVQLHGGLIAFLGYTPVVLTMGWFDAALRSAYLDAVTRADTLFLLWSLLGALVVARAALSHRRTRLASCGTCGRSATWTPAEEAATRDRAMRVGRIAVAVGVVSALVYPAMRLPWAFGYPAGMDAETFAELQASGADATGIALGTAGLVGAILMLGLVQRWGERFPRWMVGLAGRRVPVSLAVVPASLVAVALVASGRGFLVGALGLVEVEGGVGAVHLVPLVAMLPWGIALGVATAAYAVRRRPGCAACATAAGASG